MRTREKRISNKRGEWLTQKKPKNRDSDRISLDTAPLEKDDAMSSAALCNCPARSRQ
jgi:hypothetical protein